MVLRSAVLTFDPNPGLWRYIPYVAKFSRPKNFANRFQKGGAEIFATKIFAKAALIHCVIL